MTVAEHLVARTFGGVPFVHTPAAPWMWAHLRRGFPDALARELMREHVHLVAAPGGGARFRRILGAFRRRFGLGWDVLEPQPANTVAIAGRMIRYAFANPRREGLVADPWQWHWSTLRDLAGAVVDRWTDMDVLASTLLVDSDGLLLRVTATADARPTPPPPPRLGGFAAPDAIRRAVASALRVPVHAALDRPIGRRLAVQTAASLHGGPANQLAQAFGLNLRTVRRLRAAGPHPGLEAVRTCLTDPRLGPPVIGDALPWRARSAG